MPTEEERERLKDYLKESADDFAPKDPDRETSGQLRIAHRMAVAMAGKLLHVAGLGWFAWDGKRWAPDKGDKITRRAADKVIRRAWREAVGDERLAKDVKLCNSASGFRGVIDLAGSLPELSADIDELDAHPLLLNVQNGTLDLETLELKAHDPADRLTKVCAVGYFPEANGPEWEHFISSTLPDTEVREYLQRYVGQALIGKTQEQKLVIMTGTGGNGKSVFVSALNHALGDYAVVPQAEMLLAKKSASVFDGSIELRGARWAVFSEVDKGREFAPATVKRLTGGDEITTRQLYKTPVTFKPSHSLAMIVNHLPEITDTSNGMWRRIAVVPFSVQFAREDQDVRLPEKLEAPTEAESVLAWAVAGLSDYLARGGSLDEPEAVILATEEYHSRSDQISRFLKDVTISLNSATTVNAHLYNAYKLWTELQGEENCMTQNAFSRDLKDRGMAQGRRREWLNLKIKNGWEAELQNP